MNDDKLNGEARRVKGSIKEAIGKITGDRRTEAEGAAEKVAGKVQANAADAAEKVKKALDKD